MKWKCLRCGDEDIPSENLMLHFRLFHTDDDALPETWPDGEPVYYEWD